MDNLAGITNASGLSDKHKAILISLLNVWRKNRSRNKLLDAYFEEEVEPKPLGIDTVPESVKPTARCGWARKAVTSVSERVRFDGFVFDNGYADETLNKAVRDNALINSFNMHGNSELIHGCMFATVGRDGDSSIIRFHTAQTASALWDYAACRIAAGLVIANQGYTSWSPNALVVTQVNLHLPSCVVVISRVGYVNWVAKAEPHPLDRPMMEAFCFRPTGLKPFGQTRITKTVRDIVDDVSRTLQNMAVSSALYAAPQKYLLGLTEAEFEELKGKKWETSIAAVLLAMGGDEDQKTPSFGQLPGNSPQPYIDAIRAYATLFSGETGVPLNSLGVVQDNPSSSQAIEASREDICIAAQDMIDTNKESLRNIALMAMAVEENKKIDDLSPEQLSVCAHFTSPSHPSIVSSADAAIKIASAASWVTESEVFLELLGFDKDTRRRLIADKNKAEAKKMAASILDIKANGNEPGESDGD